MAAPTLAQETSRQEGLVRHLGQAPRPHRPLTDTERDLLIEAGFDEFRTVSYVGRPLSESERTTLAEASIQKIQTSHEREATIRARVEQAFANAISDAILAEGRAVAATALRRAEPTGEARDSAPSGSTRGLGTGGLSDEAQDVLQRIEAALKIGTLAGLPMTRADMPLATLLTIEGAVLSDGISAAAKTAIKAIDERNRQLAELDRRRGKSGTDRFLRALPGGAEVPADEYGMLRSVAVPGYGLLPDAESWIEGGGESLGPRGLPEVLDDGMFQGGVQASVYGARSAGNRIGEELFDRRIGALWYGTPGGAVPGYGLLPDAGSWIEGGGESLGPRGLPEVLDDGMFQGGVEASVYGVRSAGNRIGEEFFDGRIGALWYGTPGGAVPGYGLLPDAGSWIEGGGESLGPRGLPEVLDDGMRPGGVQASVYGMPDGGIRSGGESLGPRGLPEVLDDGMRPGGVQASVYGIPDGGIRIGGEFFDRPTFDRLGAPSAASGGFEFHMERVERIMHSDTFDRPAGSLEASSGGFEFHMERVERIMHPETFRP